MLALIADRYKTTDWIKNKAEIADGKSIDSEGVKYEQQWVGTREVVYPMLKGKLISEIYSIFNIETVKFDFHI